MSSLPGTLVVFLGAGLGGALRHLVQRAALAAGAAPPWGTLGVNVTGCLAMGLVTGWLTRAAGGPGGGPPAGATLRLFLATGVLGGYTTFSAFALDAATLYGRGQAAHAAAYVVGSVAASVAAAALGLALTRT